MERQPSVAIIGSGIAGMTAAALLHPRYDISVLEANDYIGGHTHTVSVELEGERHAIDTGFIVFNDRTYPNFCRLLSQLGVRSRPTEMSFSVRCDRTGLEYKGSSLNGLFAQRQNLLRPSFYRMLSDILRFNREAPAVAAGQSETATVEEFLRDGGYSRAFAEHYLLPMGAAIWSCPLETFGRFPIRFIVEFYANHGLLQIRDRPVWRVIEGGSQSYVERLTAPYRDRIRLRCPVRSVRRTEEGVIVESAAGIEAFDEVIFACHSDQALRMLADADATETSLLGAFPYSRNKAVLHTDTSVLPRRRRAWASWNYRLAADPADRPTVSYCMNILQHIRSPHTFCVSLNDEAAIDPARVLGTYNYSHPIFTTERAAAQRQHRTVLRRRRTSFCGAYWGNGFHEDGVNSALAVAEAFGVDRENWQVTGETARPRLRIDGRSQPKEAAHVG